MVTEFFIDFTNDLWEKSNYKLKAELKLTFLTNF